MASDSEIRAHLLEEYGPCVCGDGICHDDRNDDGHCRPCVHLDPESPCFEELQDEAARLAYEVAEFGAVEARRAREVSEAWSEWAAELEDLLGRMPRTAPSVAPPRCMDDIGDKCDVWLGAGHVDPLNMRGYLGSVVASADALSAAWLRAAVRVEERTEASVDEIQGTGEVSRG